VDDVTVNLDSIATYYHGPGSTLNYVYNYRNPEVTDRSDTEVALYVQDSWVIDEHWTVEGGLRFDQQSIIKENNIAPRAGVAYDPQGRSKSKVYANFGRFYDSVFVDFVDFLDSDGSTATLNLYYADYGYGYSAEIYNYDYAIDGNLEAPYRDSWTVGYEQELPFDLKVGVSTTHWKGHNQLRASFVTDLGDLPSGIVLDPAANAGVILDSKGRSEYRDWKFTIRKPFSRNFELLGSYTHSSVRGDASEDFGFENRSDPSALDYTRLSYDRPELVSLSAFGNLPYAMEITGIYRYQSGRLYSPLTFSGQIDTALGGKNSRRMQAQRSLDLSLAKRFRIGENQFKLTGQVFNLTNELNIVDVERFSGSGAAFGQPVAVDFGRTIQFGVEFRHQ
jgi:hypothetical protein